MIHEYLYEYMSQGEIKEELENDYITVVDEYDHSKTYTCEEILKLINNKK
jgi:hypothetical protein